MPALTRREQVLRSQAKRRFTERIVIIPPTIQPERRAACQDDALKFCQTYFPEKFYQAWTEDRVAMVEAMQHAIRHGGDNAVAGPRGEGKTGLAEVVAGIWAICYGHLQFPFIAAATDHDSKRILANVKYEFETNERLAEDFPEICTPIRKLEGANQRAASQIVVTLEELWRRGLDEDADEEGLMEFLRALHDDGEEDEIGQRTNMKWGADYVIMPTVEGSLASGAVLAAGGVDGAIRGIRYRNVRPDCVIIDDPDTRESANSEVQTAKRIAVIEGDLAGLGGPGKKIARVMLCTTITRSCIAWQYTDPKLKPSWRGRRYRLMVKEPDRMELWDEYCYLRAMAQMGDDDTEPDPLARAADDFYLANRMEMEKGAVISNPQRFDGEMAEDDRPLELSALQHCFNIIADRGREYFDAELQNEPPEEAAPEETSLTPHAIQQRISGRERGHCPPGTIQITEGIDCGKTYLHYTVIAWTRDGAEVIDYGVDDVYNADQVGERAAVIRALQAHDDRMKANPYIQPDTGEERQIDLSIVDSGWKEDAVYWFVAGSPRHRAAKGRGSSKGQKPFPVGQQQTKTRRVGHHWIYSLQANGLWLCLLHADYWKRFIHERFETEPGRTGALMIFGDDPRKHQSFGRHIMAEKWKPTKFVAGHGVDWKWVRERKANHWFDTTYMAAAAGSMQGISPMPVPPASRPDSDGESPQESGNMNEEEEAAGGEQPKTSTAQERREEGLRKHRGRNAWKPKPWKRNRG